MGAKFNGYHVRFSPTRLHIQQEQAKRQQAAYEAELARTEERRLAGEA